MTDEERLAETQRYSHALRDALLPFIGQNGKNLLMVRCFFVVDHGDETASGGQFGMAQSEDLQDAANCLIVGHLMGTMSHGSEEHLDRPKRN